MADRRQIVTAFFSAPEILEVESFLHKAIAYYIKRMLTTYEHGVQDPCEGCTAKLENSNSS